VKTKTVAAAPSKAEIFARLWEGKAVRLSVPVARHVLKLGFSDNERARVVDLVRRHGTGELTAIEIEEMDNYLKVGDLLALLQSKARQFLKPKATLHNSHG
jgi:hypothetical protein